MRRWTAAVVPAAALGVALLGAACDGPAEPGEGLFFQVEGRLERGSTAQLVVSDRGRLVDPSRVEWSVDPPGAVAFPADGRVRFLKAGRIELRAIASGASVARRLRVARPPTVVFDGEIDGNRELFRVELDGRNQVRLTRSPRRDAEPTVALGRVVFSSVRTGRGELHAVPLDGGEVVRLTDTRATEREPALSPDGERLAYVRGAAGAPRVFLAGADAAEGERITAMAGIEGSPAWAPDGDRLAFISTAPGSATVFTWAEGAGADEVRVTVVGAGLEPAWGPHGRYLAYAATRGGADSGADLFLLELESGREIQLTERAGSEGRPVFLPDGRLVFVAFTSEGSELRWIDPRRPDNGTVRIPVDAEDPENPAAEVAPRE